MLARVVHPHVEESRPRAPAEQRRASGPSKYSGKIVKTSMRTVPRSELEQAVGRVDHDDAVDRSTTNTIGTSASASSTRRSCAGFASTPTTVAQRRAGAVVDHGRPDELVHPELAVVELRVGGERLGGEHVPQEGLGATAVVDAVELHQPLALVRARRGDDQLTVAGAAPHRARRARAGCS